ncbi:MAG: hypothetical protein ACT6QT_08180 [Sphingopyxis sp.]|jgi:hypothetical protein|uniref:hypothetical protein n=1 Tax=unclassified Sphingopyxis TaxID=2614943 RepID=UPI0008C5F296|nr:hypothetical protein [Sphingopyxis sp. OPL5]OHD03202.1 MAG: hypothetical protein A2885_05625 [Sphingopyxis sp. RIFCSPHIGHO2_01_FULL_65_24]QNO27866.1 hypothetical protein EEB18_002475 [Sphingopyxis sp. OPL5]
MTDELSSPPPPETEAGIATAEDGLVLLDGPDGVALTMTAAAARSTGESLIEAARRAEDQLAARRS